jgi:SAM-dependent methyltransferase
MTDEQADTGPHNQDQGYDPRAYGEHLGSRYDDLYPLDGLETSEAVDFLAELAKRHDDPSLLEFGIGTGRLALRLHHGGLRVAGVEASERMVAALRSKDGGDRIQVVVGDYVDTRVPAMFSVVAIVFNNILDPRGLPAQLKLFQNAADHLVPGGHFVVESYVLADEAKDGSWSLSPRQVTHDRIELQYLRYDIETNIVDRQLMHLRRGDEEVLRVRDGYAAPGELDVQAYVTGFRRVERYSSWARHSFTALSRRHITVYEQSRGRGATSA